MWRSSLESDEQQACHAPWIGLDIPLIYSLNVCCINWSIQQEKDKKEKKNTSTKPAIILNNQTSLLACASRGWNIQRITKKHQKSMFKSMMIRVCLAIEIMSHLDAYNFPAEWQAKWHVARFSLRSLFQCAACSRFAASPASQHACHHWYSALTFSNWCWRVFMFLRESLTAPIFLRSQSFDMVYVCLC